VSSASRVDVIFLTAVPVPEQLQKAKASKLCKNTRKKASRSGDAPPLKQRRLGLKPVKGMIKPDTGQSVSGSQVSDMAAECAASQRPSSSQLNSSFTDR